MELKLKSPRKINQIRYTKIVSLPIAWTRAHNIKKGDLVDFKILEDGSLNITYLNEKINSEEVIL